MSSLFDLGDGEVAGLMRLVEAYNQPHPQSRPEDRAPMPGEIREIECRRYVWTPRDETDPFSVDEWVPVDGGPQFQPRHKESAPDSDAAAIKKREGEFRRRTHELYREKGFFVYEVASWSVWQEFDPVAHVSVTRTHRKDLYGLFDTEVFNKSQTIGINYTSRAGISNHITKMCDHKPCSSKDKTWHATHLRNWLESGRLVHVVGWAKEGRFWVPTIFDLTLEVLADKERGKRMQRF